MSPTAELSALLAETNVAHDGTLTDIVTKTQQEQPQGWLRARGKERWEVQEVLSERREHILSLFDQLNMVREIGAQKKQYTYAVVFGATIARVRARLAFLAKQWQQGIRFDYLVMLGGQRPLDPQLESKGHLLDAENGLIAFKKGWQLEGALPKTETEMCKY